MYCYNEPGNVKIVLYMKRYNIRIMSCCFENRILITLKTPGALLSATPWSWHVVSSVF